MGQALPQSLNFTTLINDIENGSIKIPQFQREFVWSKEQSARLMDSIVKGYPIGTFIFWKTKEELRTIRNIGKLKFKDTSKGDFTQYVLDGQQRLTSLYASLKGAVVTREDGRKEDFSDIFINLDFEDNEELVITDVKNLQEGTYIRLMDLVYGDFDLLASFDRKYYDKLKSYKEHIASYNFPVVLTNDVEIDIATEIFTRINIGGKSLSVFEIMVAKTFDKKNNFDLAEKYDELIEELEDVNYDTIPAATVLQTVSVILEKECSKKQILHLQKQQFINIWDEAVDAIKSAVDYFRDSYYIPVSELLPYHAMIIPFAYYFFHKKSKPTDNTRIYLQEFFWRTAISERYSRSLETRIAQDIRRIDDIIKGRKPKYDYEVEITVDFVRNNGTFSTSRSFIKAILCLYAYQQPKSFNDNAIIHISNDWLKQANSRNYHHFFPKAYLKKKGIEDSLANNVLNITIVDDYLNKREIRSKAPATYMKKFKKENPKLEETMKTHLITDLNKYGIWDNDYDLFLICRAREVCRQLKQRIK